MGERGGIMRPCLMVIDATASFFFSDVFMSLMSDRILTLLQSQEIKQASSFHLSLLSIIDGSSSCLFEHQKKKKREKVKRARLELSVSCGPSLSLTLSVIPLHLSVCLLFHLPVSGSQTNL